jgi:hypothetical protein
MRILLTKISDSKHRLEIVRDDGSRESVELASRSFLLHDLLHFAVETRAGLMASFWGMLAAGTTLAEMREGMSGADPAIRSELMRSEAAVTEAVVGVLTGVVQERADGAGAIAALARLFEAQERALPGWLTAEFVDGVREHMRRLRGEWRAVPYGGEMALEFG